jgi:hypothetical protein
MRRDDWNKPEPNIKAALGCRKLAVFAFTGLAASLGVLATGAALAVRWLA